MEPEGGEVPRTVGREDEMFGYYAIVQAAALMVYVMCEFFAWCVTGTVALRPDALLMLAVPVDMFVRRVVLGYDW
jgi:hypothetical protein